MKIQIIHRKNRWNRRRIQTPQRTSTANFMAKTYELHKSVFQNDLPDIGECVPSALEVAAVVLL